MGFPKLRGMNRTRTSLLVVALLATIAVSSCSSQGTKASPETTVPRSTTPAGRIPTKSKGPYGVGRSDLTFVDHSRTTDADTKNGVAAADSRTLPVMLLYPTKTLADNGTASTHPVAPGRFPLVVFSHGVTASGPVYESFLLGIARAGFVVAAPTFPLTSGPHGWDNLGQYRNQPKDVSFVITQVLSADRTSTSLLSGHIATDEIAAAGHSLGAITTLGLYNGCCVDKRIKAAVALSGILLPFNSKPFSSASANTPLLLIHGEADKTVPYIGGSLHTFETFTSVPRALLSFPKAGHVDAVFAKPYISDAQATMIAFLNMELRNDDTGWRGVAALVAKNGVGTIKVAGGLPSPS